MKIYKYCYIIESRVKRLLSVLKVLFLNIRGADIRSFGIGNNLFVTWPHKIEIGKNTIIEHNVFLKHDGPYSTGKSIRIGEDVFVGSECEFNIKKEVIVKDKVLIASGSRFIDHSHGVENPAEPIGDQGGEEAGIVIGENAWIGANVVILKGVTVGKGAVVGAGSVVNKDIPPYEIWGGVVAEKIGERGD